MKQASMMELRRGVQKRKPTQERSLFWRGEVGLGGGLGGEGAGVKVGAGCSGGGGGVDP